LRKGPKGDSDLPDYLKNFVEPTAISDVKALAKKILDGTYDEKKEIDWLNTITYQNLPSHKKPEFRNKNLKHIPLHVLEERELKKKQKVEEEIRKKKELEEQMRDQFDISSKPSWMQRHKDKLEQFSQYETSTQGGRDAFTLRAKSKDSNSSVNSSIMELSQANMTNDN